jgi:gluconolactonase
MTQVTIEPALIRWLFSFVFKTPYVKWILWLLCVTAALPQDPASVQVEKVASGFGFLEGPVWSRDNFLVFSDVPRNKILKLTPGEGLADLRTDSGGANGNTYDAAGRLYTCQGRARRVIREDRKSRIEILAERWQGKRLNAPSDIVVRKDGEIYFTDPAFGRDQDTRELDFYGVYHISRKGAMEVVAKPTGRPHGVALSPNGRILYVTNADERNVRAYDLDKAGEAANERVLIERTVGIPGGIRTSEDGNLFVAANGIFVYSPQGKLLNTYTLPDKPSNCAFGDADFQGLYVAARTALYRIRLDVKGSVQY